MLHHDHPDDERLSAIASHDADAADDAALVDHLQSCDRCTGLVRELGALRASLADLPDLAPPRPLRLLPPAEEADAPPTAGAAGWVRRLFAPAMTMGAALALVGVVGTAGPGLGGMAGSGDSGAVFEAAEATARDAGGEAPAAEGLEDGDGEITPDAAASMELQAEEDDGTTAGGEESTEERTLSGQDPSGGGADTPAPMDLPAERSPWPMVLFTGVALMIGAALLRWILVPRAG